MAIEVFGQSCDWRVKEGALWVYEDDKLLVTYSAGAWVKVRRRERTVEVVVPVDKEG